MYLGTSQARRVCCDVQKNNRWVRHHYIPSINHFEVVGSNECRTKKQRSLNLQNRSLRNTVSADTARHREPSLNLMHQRLSWVRLSVQ